MDYQKYKNREDAILEEYRNAIGDNINTKYYGKNPYKIGNCSYDEMKGTEAQYLKRGRTSKLNNEIGDYSEQLNKSQYYKRNAEQSKSQYNKAMHQHCTQHHERIIQNLHNSKQSDNYPAKTHDELCEAFLKNSTINPMRQLYRVEESVSQPPAEDFEIWDVKRHQQRKERYQSKKVQNAEDTQKYLELVQKTKKSVMPDYSSPRKNLGELKAGKFVQAESDSHKTYKKKYENLEIRYKNDEFGNNPLESNNALTTTTRNTVCAKLDDSCDDNSDSQSEPTTVKDSRVDKILSDRSKSSITTQSKKAEDLINLEKSRCSLFRAISEGIEKINSQRDSKTSEKSSGLNESSSIDNNTSPENNTVINYQAVRNIIKLEREHHYSIIKQEIKRLESLDKLPEDFFTKC